MKSPILKKYRLSNAKQAFIVRQGRLVEHLQSLYNRPNLAVKVFDYEAVNNLDDFKTVKWGDDPPKGEPRKNTTIWEATQIQNICAWHGLAPRVYGITSVYLGEKYRPAQLVERVDEPYANSNAEAREVYLKVAELGKQYGFKMEKEDVSTADVMGGKLIDFQTFAFDKPYFDTVKEIYINARYGKVYYQDIPELSLSGGPRKSVQRESDLGLDQIDFSDKYVLDIGCAGGYFTRLATDRGAKFVLGIDIDPEHIKAARHVANLLGYFNNEYKQVDVLTQLPQAFEGQPDWWDVVFFLSMNYHVGMPKYFRDHTREVMVFEDNGKATRDQDMLTDVYAEPSYKEGFTSIQRVGTGTDHGDKPIYHLRKDNK